MLQVKDTLGIATEGIAIPDVGNSTILLQIPYEQAKCTIVPLKMGENAIKYNVLLYDVIGDSKDYMSLFRVCSKARQGDEICIFLDTVGGSIATAIAIATALSSTKAKVTKIAFGDVMSAGTLIFDGIGEFEICKYSHFMYHMSSGGMMGSTTSIIRASQQVLDYVKDYLEESVKTGCITEEERSLILDKGQDVYITGKEMADRLKKDIYKR